MDSGSVGRYQNKPSKRQKSSKGQDMISNLPDYIISRILSFLSTKEAVRTSVLSKRWMYLWTFITDLRFKDRERYVYVFEKRKKKKQYFINFVDRVLLHLNVSRIQSFSLTLSEKYDPSHINQWISAVLSRGVKKLFVDSNELSISPLSLLRYKFIEEWVLKVDSCVIRVPSYVSLISLTVLKFSGVKFTRDYSNKLEKLRLRFPVLRSYETKNCTWSGIKGVTLEVPLLDVLSIEYRPPSLSDDSYSALKFCASRLKEFTYIGYILPDSIVLDLTTPHIASANIVPYQYDESVQETWFRVCKLLKQFNNNVECVKFQQLKVFAQAKDSLMDLPAFYMLSHLELEKISGEILLALLLKTPVLKTLILKELFQFDKELLNSAIVPDCFLSTLKVVKFGSLNGDDYELSFAKFVMENALVLEKMSFFPTWKLRLSNLEEVKEKLFSFKKGISFDILEFSADAF